MISKKRFWLAALMTMAMMLSSCQLSSKKTSEEPSSGGGTSEVSSDSQSSDNQSSDSQSSDSSTSSDSSSEDSSSSDSSSEEKTVSQIIVKEGTSLPVNFLVGDTFSVEGGILQVRYSDSTRVEIPMTLDMIENAPDMSVAHENYQVNVLYEGARTSYIINVLQGDTREEVSIGISYEYNNGPVAEITNFEEELEFVVGKEYKFYYGAYPNGAADSLGRHYLTREGVVLEDKPLEIGEYTYEVYLAEGDENYKPAVQKVNYKIVAPVIKQFSLNKDNATALTNVAGEATQTVDGITINYKNAKAADGALATLVKEGEVGDRADADNNYIEIASPVAVTDAITVEFPAVVNNYVRVYGSYDGQSFLLLDTLSRARQTTTKANGYFYFRFVNSTLGENELTINSISFSYEQDGAPATVLLKSENSDMLNGATYAEEGAFWPTSEAVYDENLSTKAIKFRNCEMHAHIEFGFEIGGHELGNYKISFKVMQSQDATYQASNSDATVKDNASVYGKLTSKGVKMGANIKTNTMAPGSEEATWTTVEKYLSDFYDDGESVDGINIWINRKCTTGFIYVDDFRLIQSSSYPRYCTPARVTVSDVTKLEFEAGDDFEFDGTIKVLFSDGYETTVQADDPNVSITAPDMSTSGNKNVVVSYTYEGVTKSFTYQITVNPGAGVNPKDEETLPIVAEENDLAKASNQATSGSSYDKGTIEDESEVTYGNSTNSIKISGLYSTNVAYSDTGVHATIAVPEVIVKETVHVKFFAKDLTYKLDLELCDDTTPKAKSVAKVAYANLTATSAGNGWTMYEYDFTTSNKNVKLLKFKCAEKTGDHNDYFYVDGLEIY